MIASHQTNRPLRVGPARKRSGRPALRQRVDVESPVEWEAHAQVTLEQENPLSQCTECRQNWRLFSAAICTGVMGISPVVWQLRGWADTVRGDRNEFNISRG